MATIRIPQEWFMAVRSRLAETGLPVRFSENATLDIERLARYHGISQAEVVRLLVNRSLSELRTPARVA